MIRKLIDKYSNLSVQIKATIWFFVCSVLQRGISTITTPIFTRLMNTSEYGQFGVFNSWLSVVQIIVTLQLCSGVYTMGVVKFKKDEKVFISSVQGLNLVLCFVWTVIYLLFHNFWNSLFSLTTVQMLAMFLMIWSSTAFNFWSTAQRNKFRYRGLVIVTLAVSFFKPVLGILFVVNSQDKVTARILGLALVEVIAYSGFFFVQMLRGKKFFSAKYWKYVIIFNLPLIPHYLSGTILAGADRIMIQKMEGASKAGIYNLAYSVSQIMVMVNNSLNTTMSPWLYQKIHEKDYKNISRVVNFSLILIAMANLVLIAVAPEIIFLFAPATYRDAIYVIPPVAMSVYFNYMYLCFAPFEFYFEKRSWTTIGTIVSAVTNVLLNYIFISIFGYQAAGYTTLICYIVNSGMHYYFMRKVCKTYLDGIRPIKRGILLLITGAFLAVGMLYIPTYSHTYLRYMFTGVLIIVVFSQRNKVLQALREMSSIRSKKKQNGNGSI